MIHSPFSRRFVGREPLWHDTPVARDDPLPHLCSAASPQMKGPCASLWLWRKCVIEANSGSKSCQHVSVCPCGRANCYMHKLCMFCLPATISSRLKEFWPARLLAMQVYIPASRLFTGSMTNECTPFSRTSILWEESGRMVCPFSCQMRSGVGKPLTYR